MTVVLGKPKASSVWWEARGRVSSAISLVIGPFYQGTDAIGSTRIQNGRRTLTPAKKKKNGKGIGKRKD